MVIMLFFLIWQNDDFVKFLIWQNDSFVNFVNFKTIAIFLISLILQNAIFLSC